MTRRETTLIAASAIAILLLVFALGISYAWYNFQIENLRHRYIMDIPEVAELAAHYAKVRQETGRWPKPGEVYMVNFHFKESRTTGDWREDFYGRQQGPWLKVKLWHNGAFTSEVTWDRPEGLGQ